MEGRAARLKIPRGTAPAASAPIYAVIHMVSGQRRPPEHLKTRHRTPPDARTLTPLPTQTEQAGHGGQAPAGTMGRGGR